MAAPQSTSGSHPSATAAPYSAEVEREAGRLALLITERAAAAADSLAGAGEVLALLVEALAAARGAVFRRRGGTTRIRPSLEPVVAVGLESRDARTLAAAARALAEGRLLVLPAAAPGQRMLALPLGTGASAGALVMAWPAREGEDDASRHIPVVVRLAPALRLAWLPVLRSERAATRGATTRGRGRGADLLARMSHDLRTPLNTMNGFVEIVLDGLAGPLNDRQREFLRYAQSSTRHLIRLIEEMVLLSQAQDHRAQGRRVPVAIATVAGKALAAVSDFAACRDVAVSVDCSPELSPLPADEARLTQALADMLRFLLARAPAGGAVRLAVSRGEDEIVFVAEGSGPALSLVELAGLFDPLPSPHGTAPAGLTGLELAVARLIAERHAGTLTADHQPDGDLSLRLALPLGAG